MKKIADKTDDLDRDAAARPARGNIRHQHGDAILDMYETLSSISAMFSPFSASLSPKLLPSE